MKINCTECGAKSEDGILEHLDTCSANSLAPMIGLEQRPPSQTVTFDTPEEQAEFMRNLTRGSANIEPKSKLAHIPPSKSNSIDLDEILKAHDHKRELNKPSLNRYFTKRVLEAYISEREQRAYRRGYQAGHATGSQPWKYTEATEVRKLTKRRAKTTGNPQASPNPPLESGKEGV